MGCFENKPIEKLLFDVMLLSPDLLCGMDVKIVSWNYKDNKRLSGELVKCGVIDQYSTKSMTNPSQQIAISFSGKSMKTIRE